ncbi:MAG: hypothetical protein OXL36_05910 [Bryobacterales bacterium]|nr:hypothetical protein [Bryobacterales bacterium]
MQNPRLPPRAEAEAYPVLWRGIVVDALVAQPVPVVSRLIGHSNTRMTPRYPHLGDREIDEATEGVGQAIAAITAI